MRITEFLSCSGDSERFEGSWAEQWAGAALRDRRGPGTGQAAVRPPQPRRLLRRGEGSELPGPLPQGVQARQTCRLHLALLSIQGNNQKIIIRRKKHD